jgi:sugar fermentation stimulation protein A
MQCPPLIQAHLLTRYKRFLADVLLPSGDTLTVHCPNTGAMTGCAEAGATVWLSTSENPKRKYPHTWELVQTLAGDMACIHSAKANALVEEAISNGAVTELQAYQVAGGSIRREVKYGEEGSRIDLQLEAEGLPLCFIEVKSVTLLLEDGLGVFPDAVSERGRKHLRELIAMAEQGHRAVLLFCVQHSGIDRVAPADAIDAAYGETLRQALEAGVEVLAYKAQISPQSIAVTESLVVLDRQL